MRQAAAEPSSAPAEPCRSVEPWFDLLAEEPQRIHHPVLPDAAAAIQLGEGAVQTDFLLPLAQPRRETVRVVDEELGRERLVIGQGFEPLHLAQPLHRDLAAGAARGIAP